MSDQARRGFFGGSSNTPSEANSNTPADVNGQQNNRRKTLLRWLPLAVFGIVILGQLALGWFAQSAVPTIEYSLFKDRVVAGDVVRVEISTAYITAAGVRAGSENPVPLYRAVPVDDPSFIDLLDANGVEYYAIPERNSRRLSTS